MKNKFKIGEIVIINGEDLMDNEYIKNQIGMIHDKDYVSDSYYVENILNVKSWYNESSLTKLFEQHSKKSDKYKVLIATTKNGYDLIMKNLETIPDPKNNRLNFVDIKRKFIKDNKEYIVFGWRDTHWPETNNSVIVIERTISNFQKKNIPYQYIVINKTDIGEIRKKEFIKNDKNMDILNIKVDVVAKIK